MLDGELAKREEEDKELLDAEAHVLNSELIKKYS